ncbi:hypothetical protein [Streptomyces sp. NPDC001787]|uniref:hypothetical protein n=1 Tax=Streptomyces sp. NPDC001787 TaxID=3154523 RepID=UPI003323C18A
MAQTRSSDEQHLLELVSLLPGWEEERFWDRVEKALGHDHARGDFSAALQNNVQSGKFMPLSHLVLGVFGQPEHRSELARLIGSEQVLVASSNRSGVGEQWIEDAVSTAWRIWLHFSGTQDEDPVEVLSRKWDLPEP